MASDSLGLAGDLFQTRSEPLARSDSLGLAVGSSQTRLESLSSWTFCFPWPRLDRIGPASDWLGIAVDPFQTRLGSRPPWSLGALSLSGPCLRLFSDSIRSKDSRRLAQTRRRLVSDSLRLAAGLAISAASLALDSLGFVWTRAESLETRPRLA